LQAGDYQRLQDGAVVLEVLDVFPVFIGDAFLGQPIQRVGRQIAGNGLVGNALGIRSLRTVVLQGAGDVLGRRRPSSAQNGDRGGRRCGPDDGGPGDGDDPGGFGQGSGSVHDATV